MKLSFAGAALAAAIAATSLAAPTAARAAAVTLTGWAFGGGGTVDVRTTASGTARYDGAAGGFAGSLSGAGALDSASLVAYCVELEESFAFSGTPMTGYSVADAAAYFAERRLGRFYRPEGEQVAERLGRLFTWVQAEATRVDTALESAALQLAVWNIVYDDDWSLTNPAGLFSDHSKHAIVANRLLAGAAATATASRLSVFVLEKAGSQDFVITTLRVPAPGTLALASLGLLAAAGLRRLA